MKTQTFFGRLGEATQQTWFTISFVLLRIMLGLQFFFAGLSKFNGWTAEGYLLSATGPFAGYFQSLAGSPVVDQLNIWGLTLIGLALVLGIFVRPASFFGAVMMLLYYVAHFEQNTAHGIIDSHIIYVFVLVMFMAGGAGHIFGIDGAVYRNLRRKNWWRNALFG